MKKSFRSLLAALLIAVLMMPATALAEALKVGKTYQLVVPGSEIQSCKSDRDDDV